MNSINISLKTRSRFKADNVQDLLMRRPVKFGSVSLEAVYINAAKKVRTGHVRCIAGWNFRETHKEVIEHDLTLLRELLMSDIDEEMKYYVAGWMLYRMLRNIPSGCSVV